MAFTSFWFFFGGIPPNSVYLRYLFYSSFYRNTHEYLSNEAGQHSMLEKTPSHAVG